jgi:hypothetical protein
MDVLLVCMAALPIKRTSRQRAGGRIEKVRHVAGPIREFVPLQNHRFIPALKWRGEFPCGPDILIATAVFGEPLQILRTAYVRYTPRYPPDDRLRLYESITRLLKRRDRLVGKLESEDCTPFSTNKGQDTLDWQKRYDWRDLSLVAVSYS